MNMKHRIGFVVGKFTPFHKGHKYLIDTALGQCDYVYVLPYSNPDLGIKQKDRESQILNHYQDVDSLLVVSPLGKIPDNDDHANIHRTFCAIELFRFIAIRNINFAGGTLLQLPDTVFTSEDYGQGLADAFSRAFRKPVSHWCVDIERKMYPISGTLIRSGGYDEWKVVP